MCVQRGLVGVYPTDEEFHGGSLCKRRTVMHEDSDGVAIESFTLRELLMVSIRGRPWIRLAYEVMTCGSTSLRGRARPE
jgi:hypothetical protein